MFKHLSKGKKLIVIMCSTIVLTLLIMASVSLLSKYVNTDSDIHDLTLSYMMTNELEEYHEVILFSMNEKLFSPLIVEKNKIYDVILRNSNEDSIDVELFFEGATYEDSYYYQDTLKSNENKTISLLADESTELYVSFNIVTDNNEYGLVTSEKGLKWLYQDSGVSNIDLIYNVEHNGNLIIGDTLYLGLNSYNLTIDGDLLVLSEIQGELSIINESSEQIFVGKIYIDAPLWTITIGQLFGNLQDDNWEYYVDANVFNEKELNNKQIIITSKDMWEQLYDTTLYPKLKENITVKFIGDFAISDEADTYYQLTFPISINLEGSVDTKNVVFNFAVWKQGDISISTTNNKYSLINSILLETPGSNIIWEGDDIPEYDYVAEQMNVKSYNGVEVTEYLGGYGKEKVIDFSLTIGQNKDIKENIYWSVSGNIITGKVGYIVSNYHLSLARPTIKVTGGEVTFPESVTNSDGSVDLSSDTYLMVKDENGDKRYYEVRTTRLIHDLPVIHIKTQEMKSITRDTNIVGMFSISVGDNSEYDSLETNFMTIRGRGNSTWTLDKKPYILKSNKKVAILGMEPAKNWVLLANHADKTLIRNRIAFSIGRVLNNLSFVPNTILVDLFLNGEYQGVYSIGERIEAKSGRVEIDNSSGVIDTGYLIEVGGAVTNVHVRGEDYFHATTIKFARIRSPKNDELTKERFDYISGYVKEADEAVISLDNYEDYIDIPSLIDWFILHELSYNIDSSFRRSCYMTKDAGGKLMMGPPWDFDLAFGNFSKDNPNYNNWSSVGTDDKDSYVKVTWMNYLLKDQNFNTKLKQRWNEVKDDVVNAALDEIENSLVIIEQSKIENFKLWNVLGVRVLYEPRKTVHLDSYEKHVSYLKDFIVNRSNWMDKAINALP